MRKSKADAAETRKRILSTASGIFLRHGIAATAISDVMIAAGLTQGGFYRHFESKEQLVAEATATAFDELIAAFDSASSGKSPREAIDVIVHLYLNQHAGTDFEPRCPLANLSSELRLSDDGVKVVALEGYSRFVKLLASYLMRLDYTDYVGMAESIVSVVVGAVTLSRVAVEPSVSESIVGNAQRTVDILLQGAPTSPTLMKISGNKR